MLTGIIFRVSFLKLTCISAVTISSHDTGGLSLSRGTMMQGCSTEWHSAERASSITIKSQIFTAVSIVLLTYSYWLLLAKLSANCSAYGWTLTISGHISTETEHYWDHGFPKLANTGLTMHSLLKLLAMAAPPSTVICFVFLFLYFVHFHYYYSNSVLLV